LIVEWYFIEIHSLTTNFIKYLFQSVTLVTSSSTHFF